MYVFMSAMRNVLPHGSMTFENLKNKLVKLVNLSLTTRGICIATMDCQKQQLASDFERYFFCFVCLFVCLFVCGLMPLLTQFSTY